jgi:adenosylmethionine-8-amino-7-oxononanoate aminotransferase
MDRLDALDRAATVTGRLDRLLAELMDHELVSATGGAGCFRALRLSNAGEDLPDDDVVRVAEEVRRAGALVTVGPSCVQLAPALVYEEEHVADLSGALRTGLDRAAETILPQKAARS